MCLTYSHTYLCVVSRSLPLLISTVYPRHTTATIHMQVPKYIVQNNLVHASACIYVSQSTFNNEDYLSILHTFPHFSSNSCPLASPSSLPHYVHLPFSSSSLSSYSPLSLSLSHLLPFIFSWLREPAWVCTFKGIISIALINSGSQKRTNVPVFPKYK